jgi:hypothetical protein
MRTYRSSARGLGAYLRWARQHPAATVDEAIAAAVARGWLVPTAPSTTDAVRSARSASPDARGYDRPRRGS